VLTRWGSLGGQGDGVTPTSNDKHQNDASGCLFMLFWGCVVLVLLVVGFFAFVSYVAESVGS